MQRNKGITTSTALVPALALTLMLGLAGAADAQGPRGGCGYYSLSPEQQKAAQEIQDAFDARIRPVQQQLFAKQAELDALYYKGTPQNDAKVQSLMKEIRNLDSELYTAFAEQRKQMNDKDIPHYGGMRRGFGCPAPGPGFDGPGNGYPGYGGHGYGGHGMMRRGMHRGYGHGCN
ncbi:MAG: hypothetical protein LBR82_08915 [Desulfovibrio sp.]|nr:hypothetical protein [Desulfovibrio sp.]